jgi:hypothetical protein
MEDGKEGRVCCCCCCEGLGVSSSPLGVESSAVVRICDEEVVVVVDGLA